MEKTKNFLYVTLFGGFLYLFLLLIMSSEERRDAGKAISICNLDVNEDSYKRIVAVGDSMRHLSGKYARLICNREAKRDLKVNYGFYNPSNGESLSVVYKITTIPADENSTSKTVYTVSSISYRNPAGVNEDKYVLREDVKDSLKNHNGQFTLHNYRISLSRDSVSIAKL